MIAELGLIALIVTLCFSLLLSVVPMVGSYTGQKSLMAQACYLAVGIFAFTFLAYGVLIYGFISDDFSIRYVANNSNSLLPIQYKISAAWAGHEGSLLLWLFVLNSWMAAVALKSRQLPEVMAVRILSVLGMVSTGFALFTLLTSNPFTRILPFPPTDGADLNPLLQDFGLILHPPMLYMGYVGFAVVFAFAIAALLGGDLESNWARWARPWTTVAWAFLTIGIALGSWWAYYELGWGGWWFWDPVENASLMPWLVGTALIHSLAITEKRGLFKNWTILLAIFTFSLSLLGTFLVRSGVLTSVHAFASSPERGIFILGYLALVIGGSLTLFSIKAPNLRSRAFFDIVSRETLLLVNNVLLTTAAATVLIGTLFPLILESLNMGMVSVGSPYFNALFVPLSLLLMLTLGFGVLLNWKQGSAKWLWQQTRWIGLLSLIGGFALSLYDSDGLVLSKALGLTLALWIVFTLLKDIWNRTANAGAQHGILAGLRQRKASFYGMHLAHLGLAVTLIGVAVSNYHSIQRDVRMAPNETVTLGNYAFRFDGVRQEEGPNYLSDYGSLTMYHNNRQVKVLHPEKRMHLNQGNPMTEVAIDPGLWRDVYIALGEPLDDQGSWAIRLYVKPMVRWIWLGSILMALGGLLAVSDRRYRVYKKNSNNTEVP